MAHMDNIHGQRGAWCRLPQQRRIKRKVKFDLGLSLRLMGSGRVEAYYQYYPLEYLCDYSTAYPNSLFK